MRGNLYSPLVSLLNNYYKLGGSVHYSCSPVWPKTPYLLPFCSSFLNKPLQCSLGGLYPRVLLGLFLSPGHCSKCELFILTKSPFCCLAVLEHLLLQCNRSYCHAVPFVAVTSPPAARIPEVGRGGGMLGSQTQHQKTHVPSPRCRNLRWGKLKTLAGETFSRHKPKTYCRSFSYCRHEGCHHGGSLSKQLECLILWI